MPLPMLKIMLALYMPMYSKQVHKPIVMGCVCLSAFRMNACMDVFEWSRNQATCSQLFMTVHGDGVFVYLHSG